MRSRPLKPAGQMRQKIKVPPSGEMFAAPVSQGWVQRRVAAAARLPPAPKLRAWRSGTQTRVTNEFAHGVRTLKAFRWQMLLFTDCSCDLQPFRPHRAPTRKLRHRVGLSGRRWPEGLKLLPWSTWAGDAARSTAAHAQATGCRRQLGQGWQLFPRLPFLWAARRACFHRQTRWWDLSYMKLSSQEVPFAV